jgi:hypothetical protein
VRKGAHRPPGPAVSPRLPRRRLWSQRRDGTRRGRARASPQARR